MARRTVEVVDCAMPVERARIYGNAEAIVSRVFPALNLRAEEFFE